MVAKHIDLATRAQALALAEHGVPMDEIQAITHIAKSTVYRYKALARQRGYDPAVSRVLKDEYLADEPRPGRPPVLTEEQKKDLLMSVVDENNKKKSAQSLASEHGISATTVLRVLHEAKGRPKSVHHLIPTKLDSRKLEARNKARRDKCGFRHLGGPRTEDVREPHRELQSLGPTATVAGDVEAVDDGEDIEDVDDSEWRREDETTAL